MRSPARRVISQAAATLLLASVLGSAAKTNHKHNALAQLAQADPISLWEQAASTAAKVRRVVCLVSRI
jgi:hypothetical protein